MKFNKKVVTLILTLIIVFTIAVFYSFLKTGSEPQTLIIAFFGFVTGELWLLASIKKTEVKEGEKDEC